jgi:hypothetical protein
MAGSNRLSGQRPPRPARHGAFRHPSPRPITVLVTTMMTMEALNMPIIVVGDMSMRPRASASTFDLAE